MTSDQIRLEVPAQAAYGRLGRIAAANLCAFLAYPNQRTDDLRLAMDEAAVMLLDPTAMGGRLVLQFTVENGGLSIDMQVVDRDGTLGPERAERLQTMAADLVSELSIDLTEQRVRISITP